MRPELKVHKHEVSKASQIAIVPGTLEPLWLGTKGGSKQHRVRDFSVQFRQFLDRPVVSVTWLCGLYASGKRNPVVLRPGLPQCEKCLARASRGGDPS